MEKPIPVPLIETLQIDSHSEDGFEIMTPEAARKLSQSAPVDLDETYETQEPSYMEDSSPQKAESPTPSDDTTPTGSDSSAASSQPEAETSAEDLLQPTPPRGGAQEQTVDTSFANTVEDMEAVETDSFKGPSTTTLMKMFTCVRGDYGSCQENAKTITMTAMNKPKQVMDLFYDNNICDTNNEREVYDEKFTTRFIGEMFLGVTILVLQAPQSPENDSYDWKGKSVELRLEPGELGNHETIQPKLSWTIIPGGHSFEEVTTQVSLLKIQSIDTSAGGAHDDDEGIPLTFFSITTDDGQFYVFEAATPQQREHLVAGLQNVIARLSFQLIAGDNSASSELWQSNPTNQGELPSLPSPHQTMNRLTHAMLD